MRLDHFLALASVGTKNTIREYIYNGFVSINGIICEVPATIVNPSIDKISYKGQLLTMKPVYYALNKPQNCMTARDPHTHTVFDCLQDEDAPGIFAVGRLDKDTEGLIFLTNDGDFSNKLMAPDHHIPKTYRFLSLGTLSPTKQLLLENGLDIGDSIITKPAMIQIIKKGLYSELSREIGLEKMKKIKRQPANQVAFLGEIIITEGKKHQVKRMLRCINCPIVYLERIAIGDYFLPNELETGDFIPLSADDVLHLKSM